MSTGTTTASQRGSRAKETPNKATLNKTGDAAFSKSSKEKTRSVSESPGQILRKTAQSIKSTTVAAPGEGTTRKSTRGMLPEIKENVKKTLSLSPNGRIPLKGKGNNGKTQSNAGNTLNVAGKGLPAVNTGGNKGNGTLPKKQTNNTGPPQVLKEASQQNNPQNGGMMLVAKQAKLNSGATGNGQNAPAGGQNAKKPGNQAVNYGGALFAETFYKYYIGGGNNGELVKRVMSKREWWRETSDYDTMFNFKWQQTQKGYKYDRLVANAPVKQCLNHFEFHREISTKSLLFRNLQAIAEERKQYLFDMTPLTIVLNLDEENFENEMADFAKIFNKFEENVTKDPARDKKNAPELLKFDFRRGKYLFKSSDNSIKTTAFSKPRYYDTYDMGKNLWLLKPTVLNRGRGIEIFTTLDELHNYINDFYQGAVEKSLKKTAPAEEKKTAAGKPNDRAASDEEDDAPEPTPPKKATTTGTGAGVVDDRAVFKFHTLVVQKYIEMPLCINQRKFDIRVWVLVDQNMQAYFFKEGYLRMSSETFNMQDTENKFIHLTNNAVQKYSDNYCKFENGNQLSFPMFEMYMQEKGLKGDFKGKMLPRMKELVHTSLESVKKKINPEDRKHCFEIFGYDFIIDSEFRIWLIEVNTNPCIEESSPILEMLLPRMLDDAFKITIDVMFPKPRKNLQKKPSMALSPINTTTTTQGTTSTVAPSPAGVTSTPTTTNIPVNPAMTASQGPSQPTQIAGEVSPTLAATSPVPLIIPKPAEEVQAPTPSPYPVVGYSDTENMWEHLGSLAKDTRSPMKKPTVAPTAAAKKAA